MTSQMLTQSKPATWHNSVVQYNGPSAIRVILDQLQFSISHLNYYYYYYLYSSPIIVRVIKSRRMRWAGHVARMEEGRGMQRVLVGKPEGKRPLGRPRRR